MDARPKVAAQANMVKGGGFEGSGYSESRVNFLGIENIHAVRDSWKALISVCHRDDTEEANWHGKIAESNWLIYIYKILHSAFRVAKHLEAGDFVLVHCSDGWDRTSQVVSLAMFLSDPYYRTINGFELLIEKEWLSFGHQFHIRQGHEGNLSEEAPIFLQFLECVWNCLKLFPQAFEFNEEFLIALFDHSYSGAFGTFLLNNERERVENRLWEKAPSLWLYLDQNRDAYTNFWYKQTDTIALPHLRMRHLYIWERLFLRFDAPFVNAKHFHSKKRTQSLL